MAEGESLPEQDLTAAYQLAVPSGIRDVLARKEFAEQLTTRFKLDICPDKHTLLALKMNPSINTQIDGPNLSGKAAMAEMMMAEYIHRPLVPRLP